MGDYLDDMACAGDPEAIREQAYRQGLKDQKRDLIKVRDAMRKLKDRYCPNDPEAAVDDAEEMLEDVPEFLDMALPILEKACDS
jgi:hypothetical protein